MGTARAHDGGVPAAQEVDESALAARHAIGWLVACNAVGVLLAAALLLPDLGLDGLPGYGRLMSVHLSGQLYGWCFLPWIAVGASWFLGGRDPRAFKAALATWSLTLAVGVASWLWGASSGKLFLEWSGPGLGALAAGMLVITGLLAREVLRRRAAGEPGWLPRLAMVLALLPTCVFQIRACNPSFLPPVNPDSGGATGHNLLASTLGFAYLIVPLILALRVPRLPGAPKRLLDWILGAALGGSSIAWVVIRHGDVSNHSMDQVAGLACTTLLGIALGFWMAGFRWKSNAPLYAFLFWWLVTAIDGLLIFVPGSLEHMKFTNGLVAHAHWAMAGMVTALNLLLLENLPGRTRPFPREAQWLWYAANFAMGIVLTLQGFHEAADPSVLWHHDTWTTASYVLRLIAGSLMLAASVHWLLHAWGVRLADIPSLIRRHWAAVLLGGMGLCDAATGIFLATMPNQTLAWMGIPDAATVPPGLAGLVGVFVGCVGASYLVQARLALDPGRNPGMLRALYVLSASIRGCVALYGLAAVASGRLSPHWLTVPLTDATSALLQWILAPAILRPAKDTRATANPMDAIR